MYFVTIVNKSKAISILLHTNYIQKSIYQVLESDFLSHSECQPVNAAVSLRSTPLGSFRGRDSRAIYTGENKMRPK